MKYGQETETQKMSYIHVIWALPCGGEKLTSRWPQFNRRQTSVAPSLPVCEISNGWGGAGGGKLVSLCSFPHF